MSNFNINLIKEIRRRTSASITECKKALIKANGNIDLAILNICKLENINLIKKKKIITKEGIIIIKLTNDEKYGVILELNCQTDFVLNNVNFRKLGSDIINYALNNKIIDIVKINNKFKNKINELIFKLSENIKINCIKSIQGDLLGCYLHKDRIGAIVSIIGTNKKLAKHLAMHIVASNPKYITINDIPKEIIAEKHKLYVDFAKDKNKTNEEIKKEMEKCTSKFINEFVFLNQNFIMEPNRTINDLLNDNNSKINEFIRFEIGQEYINLIKK